MGPAASHVRAFKFPEFHGRGDAVPTLENSKLHEHDARLRELESWKDATDKRAAALEERYSAIEARLLRNERQSSEILTLQHEQRRNQSALSVDLEHLSGGVEVLRATIARIETEIDTRVMLEILGIKKMLLKMVGDETSPGDG